MGFLISHKNNDLLGLVWPLWQEFTH